MKRFLLFGTILFVFFSCSKENLDKKEDQAFKISTESRSTIIPNLDSIVKMNAGAFLASNLTAQEIDSLIKVISTEHGKSNQTITAEGPEYTDWSGLLHLKYWYATTSQSHIPELSVSVGSDYVLVGGGAYTSGNNGFLTKSMPDEYLTTWTGKSKDHLTPNLHTLTVYAIGMKIDGVSSDYLRSKMQVFPAVSGKVNHPETQVTIPSNYLLVGGGAWDYWEDDMGYGNMLVSSYPYGSNTWKVSGKDHRRADPSVIYAYAIGIENISFPNVGYLQVGYSTGYSTTSGRLCTTTATVPTGWALTGPGGLVVYNNPGYGRMITSMYPYSTTTSYLGSRDSYYTDGGYQYVYALRIQKAQ